MKKINGVGTKCVHSGDLIDDRFKGATSPIFPSTAYDFIDVEDDKYPRYFNTPNQLALSKKIADLENCDSALLFGSGIAAIFTSLFSFLKSEDHVIFQGSIYGGTLNLVIKEFKKFNIEYSLVDSFDIKEYEMEIKENTKVIFIESPSGEKFKYPYKHLSGARAMALHVSEGGHAYDDFGKYISGLSEEMSKLRKFNQYVGRSTVMAETLEGYGDVVKGRIKEVKQTIANLQKPAYYKEAAENFVVPVIEDVPTDIADSWVDQLTIKQFNEELKDVFPYIYNLVGEAVKPTELGPEDLVAEAVEMCPDACCGKPVTECSCGPDCKHCDCYEKNKATNETTVSSIDSLIEKAIDKLMGQFAESEADDTMDVKINQKGQLAKAGTPEPEEEQKTPIGEFILSYFDRENGTFPKGQTAVLTMVEKDYGEQYVEPAAQFIEKVEAMVAQRNAQEAEYSRYPETEIAKQQTSDIKRLAGV